MGWNCERLPLVACDGCEWSSSIPKSIVLFICWPRDARKKQTNIVSLSSILKQIDPSVPEILTKPPLTPTPSSGAPVLGKVVLLDFGNEPLQTVWDKVAKDDPLTVDRPKLSYERDSYDFDNLHVQELKLDLPTTDLAGGSSKKGWNILNPQQKYNVVRAFYNSAITHFGI